MYDHISFICAVHLVLITGTMTRQALLRIFQVRVFIAFDSLFFEFELCSSLSGVELCHDKCTCFNVSRQTCI
jgi:hypothetical protein